MIPIPDALAEYLRQHRAYRAVWAPRGDGWNAEGYVLVTGRGTPVKPNNLSSAWRDFCRRKGLDAIRLHDLRHSFATDLIFVQHEPLNLVAELLGHADPAITASSTCTRIWRCTSGPGYVRIGASLPRLRKPSRIRN